MKNGLPAVSELTYNIGGSWRFTGEAFDCFKF